MSSIALQCGPEEQAFHPQARLQPIVLFLDPELALLAWFPKIRSISSMQILKRLSLAFRRYNPPITFVAPSSSCFNSENAIISIVSFNGGIIGMIRVVLYRDQLWLRRIKVTKRETRKLALIAVRRAKHFPQVSHYLILLDIIYLNAGDCEAICSQLLELCE